MELKIGDKVRYLNAVGGGEVIRFMGKNMVAVLEEDGFETPILVRECVLVESASRPVQTKGIESKPVVAREIDTTPFVPKIHLPEVQETREGESVSLFLAFLPDNIKSLQDTGYESYLVNDSNYFLYVNIMSKTDIGWVTRFCEEVEPNTQIFVEEISKEILNQLEHLTIQVMAYKKAKPFKKKNATSIDYKLDVVKFYKLHTFKENSYFDDPAWVLTLIDKDIPYQSYSINADELKEAILKKEVKDDKRIAVKQIKRQPILEIDLHITELLDTTTGMSNIDMLQFQLDKFTEVMEANKGNNGQRIVFIHGKGEGVLRNAIVKELNLKYKACEMQDASFREYGFGATMVTIR